MKEIANCIIACLALIGLWMVVSCAWDGLKKLWRAYRKVKVVVWKCSRCGRFGVVRLRPYRFEMEVQNEHGFSVDCPPVDMEIKSI
jgi:hypothetical protein